MVQFFRTSRGVLALAATAFVLSGGAAANIIPDYAAIRYRTRAGCFAWSRPGYGSRSTE